MVGEKKLLRAARKWRKWGEEIEGLAGYAVSCQEMLEMGEGKG